MTLFPRTALLALVLGTALVSVGTSASGATACSGPPPIPYDYLLGKVESVDAAGNARIGYSNPKAMRMYRGADLYQVTCDGVLVKVGHPTVKSFDERAATAQASFVERGFKSDGAGGQYVLLPKVANARCAN